LKKFYSKPSICENSLKTIHPPLVAIKPNKVNLDLLDELCKQALIRFESLKRRVELKPRQFRVADLVMRKAHPYQLEDKLSPKWTDPFRVVEVLGNRAYRLETLEEEAIPRTWNMGKLKFYFN